jgi:hypothetical protein
MGQLMDDRCSNFPHPVELDRALTVVAVRHSPARPQIHDDGKLSAWYRAHIFLQGRGASFQLGSDSLDLTGRKVTVVEDDEAFVPVRGLSRRARVEEQEGKDGERWRGHL